MWCQTTVLTVITVTDAGNKDTGSWLQARESKLVVVSSWYTQTQFSPDQMRSSSSCNASVAVSAAAVAAAVVVSSIGCQHKGKHDIKQWRYTVVELPKSSLKFASCKVPCMPNSVNIYIYVLWHFIRITCLKVLKTCVRLNSQNFLNNSDTVWFKDK